MDQAGCYGLLQTKQHGVCMQFSSVLCQLLWTEQHRVGSYGPDCRVFPWQMSCKVCWFQSCADQSTHTVSSQASKRAMLSSLVPLQGLTQSSTPVSFSYFQLFNSLHNPEVSSSRHGARSTALVNQVPRSGKWCTRTQNTLSRSQANFPKHESWAGVWKDDRSCTIGSHSIKLRPLETLQDILCSCDVASISFCRVECASPHATQTYLLQWI